MEFQYEDWGNHFGTVTIFIAERAAFQGQSGIFVNEDPRPKMQQLANGIAILIDGPNQQIKMENYLDGSVISCTIDPVVYELNTTRNMIVTIVHDLIDIGFVPGTKSPGDIGLPCVTQVYVAGSSQLLESGQAFLAVKNWEDTTSPASIFYVSRLRSFKLVDSLAGFLPLSLFSGAEDLSKSKVGSASFSKDSEPSFSFSGPFGFMESTALEVGFDSSQTPVSLENLNIFPGDHWSVSIYVDMYPGVNIPIWSFNKINSSMYGPYLVGNYPAVNHLYFCPYHPVGELNCPNGFDFVSNHKDNLTTDSWIHISIKYRPDGGSLRLFINGTPFTPVSPSVSSTTGLKVTNFPVLSLNEIKLDSLRLGQSYDGQPSPHPLIASCLSVLKSHPYQFWSMKQDMVKMMEHCEMGQPSFPALVEEFSVLGNTNNIGQYASSIVKLFAQFYPDMHPGTSNFLLTIDDLLKECDHFSRWRIAPPNFDEPNSLISVFAADRIFEFDSMTGTMKIFAALYTHWNVDTCLPGTLTKYLGGEKPQRVFVPSMEKVWIPSLEFTSSSADTFMLGENYKRDILATFRKARFVRYNILDFFYLIAGLFTTQCVQDMRLFPFDTQKCSFTFTAENSVEQVVFGEFHVICPDKLNTEWAIVGCSGQVANTSNDGSIVQTVTFEVTVQRIPGYFVANLILPNVVLVILSIATFSLPISAAERPIFTMTLLLSLIYSQSNILSEIPKTPQRILLSDYVLFLSFFVSFVTFFHMIILWLCSGREEKVTRSIRMVDFFGFCMALGIFIAININTFNSLF